MSKAFTKESDSADEEIGEADALPAHVKNYVTPAGLAALQEEHRKLLYEERPKIVEIVSWAAGNGDRSENGDYIYGKKRLREIDRRIRFLVKRLDLAEVVDPARRDTDQIYFGATVDTVNQRGENTCPGEATVILPSREAGPIVLPAAEPAMIQRAAAILQEASAREQLA